MPHSLSVETICHSMPSILWQKHEAFMQRLLFRLLQAVSTISTQEAAFIKHLLHSGCTPDTSSPTLASTLLEASYLHFTDRNQGSLEGDSVPGQQTAEQRLCPAEPSAYMARGINQPPSHKSSQDISHTSGTSFSPKNLNPSFYHPKRTRI